MEKSTRRLQDFRKWFKGYIRRNYGRKCRDFTWSCAACHAHFVKGLLDDFVEETVALDKWEEWQRKSKKSKRLSA